MKIEAIIHCLEQWAPLDFQESYDNSGLISGDPTQDCTGVLCSLDCTEEVVDEAIAKGCNLIVSHHPIIFKGVKRVLNLVFIIYFDILILLRIQTVIQNL
jgi:putative NIF3 family GTP cyclohydrolase 1 type 2